MNQSLLTVTRSKRPDTFSKDEVLQGRYRIVRQLGAGGMGAVYEAVDERLQATVAIKETFAVENRLRRQFEHEARLLAQLSHPALPRVSDYFTEDGRAFLVMQFIAGNDLAQIIAQQPGPFPRAHVIAWADQLLDALIYLHTRERVIIHRDIKPHNLKLTASGQIALLDFGLAKTHTVADQSTTQTSPSIFGYTRRYSPLEQIQDQGTSPQSDIYALGATLYHLLTGVKPPDALVRAAALANSKADPLPFANVVHPAIGAELSAILNKALALNFSDRFATAEEFRAALRNLGRAELRRVDCQVEATSRSATGWSVDPFDSYAILKPNEIMWSSPKRSWSAPLTVCATGVLIVLGVIGSSLVSSASDVDPSVGDYVKTGSVSGTQRTVGAAKVDKPHAVAIESPSLSINHDFIRAGDKLKRNSKRPNGNLSDPAPPSLAPALRLPAQ
ncbi:MAG TPA: serine/threonine-protein kinase [Pyrinomonadaceae bacterium]|jgi:serine/threonine protein kinase|nr:serine/threonine-protein kinase [Pyrinomonadaceae bacterium]